MAFIKDWKSVDSSYDILMDKWKEPYVTGDVALDKVPSYCVFNNTAYALDLLHYHIHIKSKLGLHTDVDFDGIGTNYIIKKTTEYLGSSNHILLMNKEREHGITEKYVDYVKATKSIDLMIITDSSSNEIETIKKFECDVLCIDHHELLNNDLIGYCNDGIHRYVIVNSTIENKGQEQDNLWLRSKNPEAFKELEHYQGTTDMSCGVVAYELMRLYCACYDNEKLIENLKLYQWAAITIFSDIIDTLNYRNQWYISKTLCNKEVESTLMQIMKEFNSYNASLTKSYLVYTFIPAINSAIRAGHGIEILGYIMNNPKEMIELCKKTKEQQSIIIDKVLNTEETDEFGVHTIRKKAFTDEYVMLDLTNIDVSKGYNGVIASRISGENKKDCVVYKVIDGLCVGSFRGKFKDVNYRQYFADYKDYIYAQGHHNAFGFKAKYEDLKAIMEGLKTLEPTVEEKPFLTVGNISADNYGEYHIEDLTEFKRLAYLYRIGIGNSRVLASDEIHITVSAKDVQLKETQGKVYKYNVLGMECKAFQILKGEYFEVYPEYTGELSLYIK